MHSLPAKAGSAAILSRICGFIRDSRAATAIEFALLSPAFIGLTFALMEVGLYEYYTAGLSYATQKGARQILLGNVANGSQVNAAYFVTTYVCPSLPPFMTCSNVVANSSVLNSETTPQGASSWSTLMNASLTWFATVPMDNTKTNFCIGSGGSTVGLQIYYAMPFYTIPLWQTPTSTFNGSTVIWVVSSAAFKNEPFSTKYTGC